MFLSKIALICRDITAEVVVRSRSVKKVFLKYLHENTCVGVSLLPACNFIKKETTAQVLFLLVLRNFYENRFCRTSSNGCSCEWPFKLEVTMVGTRGGRKGRIPVLWWSIISMRKFHWLGREGGGKGRLRFCDEALSVREDYLLITVIFLSCITLDITCCFHFSNAVISMILIIFS